MTPQTKQTPKQNPADVDGWELLGGVPLIPFEDPTILDGVYQGQTTVTGKYGPKLKYAMSDTTIVVKDADGPTQEPRVEFFERAVLKRLLADPKLQLGDELHIDYTGEDIITSDGRKAKEFIVKHRRARK